MTTVRLDVRAPSTVGADTPAVGYLEWSPTARRVVGEGADAHVTLPSAQRVPLAGAPVEVKVAATTAAWCWRVQERVSGGKTRYVAVPDTTDVLAYAELVDVDPTTLVPLDPVPPSATAVLEDASAARDQAVAAAATATNSAEDASGSAAAAAAALAAIEALPTWWVGTQAQYDALAVKDPGTLYLVTA
ncbi:phage upper tail fiber protein [Cellulomonas uda]|uniref:Minor tail protein gp31 C-terminal domain-containing protein n=1 Tax=Cellulomonas uda TaxID=1714 RepID=A0A4Y3K962_CELUD|nr:hypothetical protein [Cellulomonas uda]NII67829.1 hypothetical protein [Cellulomonas uda]GEA79924.1 hypothetical protein CUD01_03680 [Cellulomonas uda]